jgi:hypothetical protein
MNTSSDPHAPRPAFVASLERDVLAAFHRERAVVPLPRRRMREYLKAAAILVVGLVFGAGTQMASAQVQESRQRSELERAVSVDRMVAAQRLLLARLEHDRARRAFDVGAISRQSLLTVAEALRTAEMNVARIDLNLEEIRLSAAPPRDELFAPLVNGRDFVRERLTLQAALAQQQLERAEAMVAEMQRAVAIGSGSGSAPEIQLAAAQAKRDFQVRAQQLQLRETFLKERLAPEVVTRRAQRFELEAEISVVQREVELIEARLAIARQRFAIGTGVAVDVKRAELELMEAKVGLMRATLQLKAMDSRVPDEH